MNSLMGAHLVIQPLPSGSPKAATQPAEGATPPAEGAVAARPATLSRTILADGEIVILDLRPSPWFLLLASAPVLTLGAAVMLVANLWLVRELYPNGRGVLFQAGLWIMLLRLAWAVLEWSARHYILTDRRVIRQQGVLNVDVFECRLDRLQNTLIVRTLVQRVLGLGTLYFATAGTGAVEASWMHVKNPAAVHREITKAVSRYTKMNGSSSL